MVDYLLWVRVISVRCYFGVEQYVWTSVFWPLLCTSLAAAFERLWHENVGRLVFCELLNAVYSACFYSLRGSARLNIACEGPMPIPKACLLQGKRGWTGRHNFKWSEGGVCSVRSLFFAVQHEEHTVVLGRAGKKWCSCCSPSLSLLKKKS